MNIERLNVNINGVLSPGFSGDNEIFSKLKSLIGSEIPSAYINFITKVNGMQKSEGWKAVWVSPIDNYDDLDGYTEDVWDSNGEREMSPFAKEFGIDWYDPDAKEFDLEKEAKSFKELFNGVSNEDAYIDELLRDLVNYDPEKFRSFMILHDYQYEGQAKSDKAVFVGNYRY